MSDRLPQHRSREDGSADVDRFRELHLYCGSRCNRACGFCVVSGSPTGWWEPFAPEVLEAALRLVEPDGNLKLYGGEPTLHLEALLRALRTLREGGFRGWFTLFTNGVLAERVVKCLESDERCEVVLNYSILHGEGAEPLPSSSRAILEAAAARFPDRLFESHPDLVPIGRMAAGAGPPRPAFGGLCPRCRPVLTSRGALHACPFAVEYDLPHYRLGGAATLPADAVVAHRRFLGWIDEVLEPAAEASGRHPCEVCVRWRAPDRDLPPLPAGGEEQPPL